MSPDGYSRSWVWLTGAIQPRRHRRCGAALVIVRVGRSAFYACSQCDATT